MIFKKQKEIMRDLMVDIEKDIKDRKSEALQEIDQWKKDTIEIVNE